MWVKSGFIMDDKDKAKLANCLRHNEARGPCKFIPFIVPSVETSFILLKLFYKLCSVFHHIHLFLAICIHSVLFPAMSPPQFAH